MATNSDGQWNGAEAAVDIEIEPAYWQTLWFRLSSVLAAILAIVALYRFRAHQLTRRLNARFEERLSERTRIARELHDTLLQGFLSASMQLHVAVDQLPDESPSKPRLARVQELVAQVIEEGRHAVQGLRSTDQRSDDLETAFSRIRGELPVADDVRFRVMVEGRARPLHPVLRDEIYRIGREALINAFRHSGAKNIEVELDFEDNQLRLIVRDDGRGIDPQVLRSGREGHWGLSEIRERAEKLGARLTLWSRDDAGTEVALVVPGQIAFTSPPSNGPLRRISALYSRKARAGSPQPEKERNQ